MCFCLFVTIAAKSRDFLIDESWWPHLKPLTKRGGGPALNPHNLKPRAFLQEIVTWRFAPSGSAGRAVVQKAKSGEADHGHWA